MSEEVICKVCSARTNNIFSAKVLKKYNVKYYFCPQCGFLQTEEPYWINEAYNSAIGIEDTGILRRNSLLFKKTSILINLFFNRRDKFLDYAGGYGIFVRLMRDAGYDFYWHDPFSKNLIARGFELKDQHKIELVTAFECFEHFINPVEEIEKILNISKVIIFSTRVFRNEPPNPDRWWYYSLNSGQHISLYSIKTLRFLAQKYGLLLNTDYKSFHMFSPKKINNIYFNILNKISFIGLASVFNIGMKSRTASDFNLITGKKI